LPSGNALQHIKHSLNTMPDNVGLIVVPANDLLTQVFASMVTKMIKQTQDRIVIVRSVDQAREVIGKRRSKA
jgi:hypothetical protein